MPEPVENREEGTKKDGQGKRILLVTYGCQMNTRDAEVIAGMMRRAGFGMVDSAESADAVIFVTCAVRQHAEDKVWSEIGRVAKMSPLDLTQKACQIKAGGTPRPTKKIVGLVGCMAELHKEKVFERSKDVDFVVGPQDIHKIPEIIKKFTENREQRTEKKLFERKIWEPDGDGRPEEIYHTGFYQDKGHTYVVISEGCSNFCSYCVVPYVRGPLRHRNYQDILSEIELAVSSGRRRITLLGQNVCAYGAEDRSWKIEDRSQKLEDSENISFMKLLELVNQIKGLKEFSFITSHPKDTTVGLFRVMQGLDKLKKYLHLPVQSGSDRILQLMNRGYSREYYLDLVDNYRSIVKDGVLTTDIIVGFPGETEKDFEDTVDLVSQVQFNAGFIFKYSPRPWTCALNFADDVTKQEKERRHKIVLELQKKISRKFRKFNI